MNYTDLPEPDRYSGNHLKGEIEITDAPGTPLPVEYADKYIAVVNDRVRFPDGKSGRYLRIFHQSQFSGKHGTVMLARKEGVYVLIRIFRHTTRSWELECPRGFAEPDITEEENARREIHQELGVAVTSLEPLGDICPDTGLMTSRAKAFLVELESLPESRSAADHPEAIAAFVALTADELMEHIARGEIRDGFSLSAIMLALATGKLGRITAGPTSATETAPVPEAPAIKKQPEAVPAAHSAGCFIEGFDSILYNPALRVSNQYRFLAELYYGFIYDSRIVMAEPMVFDNQTMIRLLRRMKEQNLGALHGAVRYVSFRNPSATVEKTFLSPDYICSALSPEAEAARKEVARHLSTAAMPWDKKLAHMLDHLRKNHGPGDDDLLVLENFDRGIKDDWPWRDSMEGNTGHGYSMSCQVSEWLLADDARYGGGVIGKVMTGLKDAAFYPPESAGKTQSFSDYFKARSSWHKTKPVWRQLLGGQSFGRMDEYVNSAYMEAIRRTCRAATSVQTPMNFANADNIAAQSIINDAASASAAVSAFEFKLHLHAAPPAAESSQPSVNLRTLEDAFIGTLDDLYRDDGFAAAKRALGAIDLKDPDYSGKYVDCFSSLARIVNRAGGPFNLIPQGDKVVNVIPNISECARETRREDHFAGANGCEHHQSQPPVR